jgi:hypothetical protein
MSCQTTTWNFSILQICERNVNKENATEEFWNQRSVLAAQVACPHFSTAFQYFFCFNIFGLGVLFLLAHPFFFSQSPSLDGEEAKGRATSLQIGAIEHWKGSAFGERQSDYHWQRRGSWY